MKDDTSLAPVYDDKNIKVMEVQVRDLWLFAPFCAELARMIEEEGAGA